MWGKNILKINSIMVNLWLDFFLLLWFNFHFKGQILIITQSNGQMTHFVKKGGILKLTCENHKHWSQWEKT